MRHLRLICYSLVVFAATLVASSVFSFTLPQSLAYCVAAYLVLNAVNYRKVLAKSGQPSR